MKQLQIGDREEMIFALQDEIRRSSEAKYDHRLHAVLLVAQGMSCRQTAGVLGDAPRTVEYWVKRFEKNGFGGLADEEKSGRPSRLNPTDRQKVENALRKSPVEFGLSAQMWDGPLLSAFLKDQMGVELHVRQCQRLFRQMGFRLRKPRPQIATADPALQAAHKKTP
ncbi:MAG: winged helix-turn-helix domain-containing protein [Planctomycetota bacterium]